MHRNQDHGVGSQRPTARPLVATQQQNVVKLRSGVGGVGVRHGERIGTSGRHEHVVDHIGELIGPNDRESGRKSHHERAEHGDERGQSLTRTRIAIVDHLDHRDQPRDHEQAAYDLHDQQHRGVEHQTRDAVASHESDHDGRDRHEYTEEEQQPRHELASHERRCPRQDQ